MRLYKCFSIISVILLLCLLCTCTKGGNNLEVRISSSDKTLIDLASKIYDESQMLEIIRFNGSINELNSKYPIECLRNNEGTYRASYLGKGRVAVILFDNSGNKIFGNIYNALHLKSDFSGLAKGQPLEKVREVDPEGEYLFLYTGRNDTPKLSSHYTKDGYLITIEYDYSNTITNIKEEFI